MGGLSQVWWCYPLYQRVGNFNPWGVTPDPEVGEAALLVGSGEVVMSRLNINKSQKLPIFPKMGVLGWSRESTSDCEVLGLKQLL